MSFGEDISPLLPNKQDNLVKSWEISSKLKKKKKKNLKAIKAIHSFLTFCTQIPAALNAAKKTEKPAALPKHWDC